MRAKRPLHGQASDIRHDGSGVFANLSSPLTAGRYHSLISVFENSEELIPCAWSDEGEMMAVRHATNPWFGLQFHPESVLTENGRKIIRNFLRCLS